MEDMHCFDDNYIFTKTDNELIEKYSSNFTKEKDKIIKTHFNNNANAVKSATSIEDMIILSKALSLGKPYYDIINNGNFDLAEKKLLLYGFTNNLNVLEQLEEGETIDNLKLIIEASTYDDFKLNDFFDATGSYLNPYKLKNYIKLKKKK